MSTDSLSDSYGSVYNDYCDLHDPNTMVIVICVIQTINGYCDLGDQPMFNCDVCDQRKKQRITVLLVLCEL